MKTITVCLQNDEDAELLKSVLQSTQFKEEIETFEEEEEYTDEDIAEWDRRLAEYEKDPSKGKSIDEVRQILKQKYGV